MSKVPLYLVTGFLGSGKTTFLKQMLAENESGLKIGIIQNEFAPQNMDAAELNESGKSFQIVEINNGSVFCICLLQEFTHALIEFVDQEKPDVVFLESSGVSDPIAIAEIMQSPILTEKVFLSGVICLVDAINFEKQNSYLTRIEHQVLVADNIIINKSDRVDHATVERIKSTLSAINALADIHTTSFCKTINWRILKSYSRKTKGHSIKETDPDTRPALKAGVFKSARKIGLKNLESIIKKYKKSAIRIKGFVLLDSGKSASVQTVFDEFQIRVLDRPMGNTSLILLGENFNLHEFSKEFRLFVS